MTAQAEAKALSNDGKFVVSPTPSSVCPTESTAPGDSELRELEVCSEASGLEALEEESWESPEAEAQASTSSQDVRNWRNVSERLGALFSKLACEDSSEDEDIDFARQEPPAFTSVLRHRAGDISAKELFSRKEVQKVPPAGQAMPGWQSVGSRVALVLQDADSNSEESEPEPQPGTPI
mmetsp:Transcript_11988/g.21225  ORF Transcript_11988/g.21225 Transcript_11988/m.21225 type:complete len:179 (-) Transcript_11988:153-689(-)